MGGRGMRLLMVGVSDMADAADRLMIGDLEFDRPEPCRVAVGYCCHRNTFGLHAYTYASVTSVLQSMGFENVLGHVDGTALVRSRNTLAEIALANDARYLCMMDDDMGLPAWAVLRLIAWRKALIAVPYVCNRHDDPRGLVNIDEVPVNTQKRWDELEAQEQPVGGVTEIGAGCMVIDCDVLKRMGGQWFNTPSGLGGSQDYAFCRKVRSMGYEVFADFGVPAQHWGFKPYDKGSLPEE